MNFTRGTFRVHGDVVEVYPAGSTDVAIRIEFFGDEIDRISEIDVLTGEVLGTRNHISIFPASHYVTNSDNLRRALRDISAELDERVKELNSEDKLLEAQSFHKEQTTIWEMMMEWASVQVLKIIQDTWITDQKAVCLIHLLIISQKISLL